MSEPLTPEEEAELAQYLQGGVGSPSPEDKHNVHKFIHDVAISKDTTKTGFLSKDELGLPKHPVRVLKELALFCQEVGDMDYFSDYFNAKAEIITSTSLSRNAKLLDTAVVSRREMADVTKRSGDGEKKGWFKKKNKGEGGE